MGDGIRDTLGAELDALDLAQFIFGLFGGDSVDDETPLGVVDQAEVFASLVNGDDV